MLSGHGVLVESERAKDLLRSASGLGHSDQARGTEQTFTSDRRIVVSVSDWHREKDGPSSSCLSRL